MMTAVFMCQPLGQLAATLVTLIAVATHKNSIPLHATAKNCDRECIKTMDSIWRWVIGVGVIPALLALWFRLTIIESARYTADVGRDSKKAASELNRYLPTEPDSAAASVTSGRPLNQPRLRKPLVNWNARSTSFDSQGQQPHIPLDVHIEDQITASESENKPPPVPSWEDFKDYFWTKGNLRTLITTSLCWFAVDLPF
jgi:PHS family inorganic phosphate transporter-like MFS transporter